MKISALYYYPIKSLAGITANELRLDAFGPAADRRWMLVDSEGRFVTQRKHPALALVVPELDGGGLSVSVPGGGRHEVIAGSRWRTVTVWRDQTDALAAKPGPSEALSRYLGFAVELVYMPDDRHRQARADGLTGQHPVSFADGFPFLVASQSSLDDLNRRLPWFAEMRRFRPNVVVEGGRAWAEDSWRTVSLGTTRVDLVKPCSRCVMTTVDPSTGTRSPDGEPLRTLASFRRTEAGVLFGVNGIHHGEGVIRVGDSVAVLEQIAAAEHTVLDPQE